jgi:Heterokaryon incompatibility protein (HET)
LELYRSLIGSKEDRLLCDECARFDWRYHLVGFEGRSPMHWDNYGAGETTEDIEKRTRSDFGGEYELRDSETSFTLPSLANALENETSCTFCSLLVSALRATATGEQIEHIAKDAQPIEVCCKSPFDNDLQDRWVLYVRFCSDEQVAVGTWDVITIRFALHTTPDSLTCDPMVRRALKAAGRDTIPSTQIDLGVIRSWWQRCKAEHPECRKKSKGLSSDPTSTRMVFRVIDVEKNEVVIAPKACAYVALSYVWGGIDAYQSKKCRKTSDVLTGDEIVPIKRRRLPKTIRDAMRVTELIGERYLWVDALCIVQDDDFEKAMTISGMDKIYRNSLLTIVAADGRDAHSGLVGLEAGSRLIRSVVACRQHLSHFGRTGTGA